jgi:hypothetical protein
VGGRTVLFLYIYGYYFELYAPGKLQAMLAGRIALGPVSRPRLLGMAALMALPSLLVGFTALLPARLTRWLNVGAGLLYTVLYRCKNTCSLKTRWSAKLAGAADRNRTAGDCIG